MEERIDEGKIKGAIDSLTLESTLTIVEQMKTCICKIYADSVGTGFFCKLIYQNKKIPVLMTNYHILSLDYLEKNKKIKISINDEKWFDIININEKSIIYSSKKGEYDLTIIQLTEEKEIYQYLELDDNLFNNNSEELYKEKSIYILHYPMGVKISVSYGYGIELLDGYNIKHLCNTEFCSSGSPILNLTTNKVIGIHCGAILEKNKNTKYNIGVLLKYPLNVLNSMKINKNKETFSEINDFEFIETIAKDNYNEISRYRHKINKNIYIIKKYSKSKFINKEAEIDFEREKVILFEISQKNNPHFAKLNCTFEDPSIHYLVFDNYEGQTLKDFIKSKKGFIEEKTIIHILKEMLNILQFLHNELHVMNRDIKPENIIIDKNNNIKLIEFHLAAYLEGKNNILVSRKSLKGPVPYVAPEILFAKNQRNYDYKCDIFSLGYTIFYLMNKELPTKTIKENGNILVRKNNIIKKNNYSPWLNNLVESLYDTDMINRPDASQALQILSLYTPNN